MSTLRDDLLPVVEELRQIPADLGLRRFAVTLRRRIWSGAYVGDGTAINEDLVITPLPRVRDAFSSAGKDPKSLEYLIMQGNVIKDRYYTISKITPAWSSNGQSGGFSAQQIRMRPNPDVKNIEPVVILAGDDGFIRECIQVSVEIDRPFGYSMLVQETDRPKVALQSIAVTPSPASALNGSSIQFTATGTYEGGTTSDITPICRWSSSDLTKATIDLLGNTSALAAGTTTIVAALGNITSPGVTLTVT